MGVSQFLIKHLRFLLKHRVLANRVSVGIGFKNNGYIKTIRFPVGVSQFLL